MHRLLFKNRFNALVFVVAILFSVGILVGTDDQGGALDKATTQFGAEPQHDPQQQKEESPARTQSEPGPAATEFTPDEDLIDDTEGLDPSGWSAEPADTQGPGPETAQAEPDGPEGMVSPDSGQP